MIIKESVQIVRDPSTLLIAFILPLLLIFMFGYCVNLDTPQSPIGIAQQDDSEAAKSLAAAFQASKWFDVRTSGTMNELSEKMVAGEIRGIIVIPDGFGRRTAGGGGDVLILADGSMPNTASFISAYAEGVRATWEAARTGNRNKVGLAPISTAMRFWYNPELKSRNFLVPGAIAVVMTMVGTLLTSLVIAREWERGTLESIMATPLTMPEFIATKVIPYFLLAIISMTLCTAISSSIFGVPFRGSFIALILIASAFLLPALGQGILISAATKNQFVATQVALLTAFLPTVLLSGFLFEISSMPTAIQYITFLVPSRYLIPPLQTVFIVGNDWSVFLPNMLKLLGFGVVFFAAAVRVTKRKIA
tara:strand:- start:4602 stop:5690 length:1089 start_codon:yes stop_codon:yes gene_type:complete